MAAYEDTRYDFDGQYLEGLVLVDTGTIVPWPTNSVPSGYLDCNGAAVSRSTYADLFAVIGTTYGSGDGSTTFNVPNIKDRVCRRANSVNNKGGANTASCSITTSSRALSLNQIPSHSHNGPPGKGSDGIGNGSNNTTMGYAGNWAWGSRGGGAAHSHNISGGNVSTVQPYVATFFIIKT